MTTLDHQYRYRLYQVEDVEDHDSTLAPSEYFNDLDRAVEQGFDPCDYYVADAETGETYPPGDWPRS